MSATAAVKRSSQPGDGLRKRLDFAEKRIGQKQTPDCWKALGRKADGVEPSWERLTPPTGFEAQPHHRIRMPSSTKKPQPRSHKVHRTSCRRLSARNRWTSRWKRVYPTRSKNSKI